MGLMLGESLGFDRGVSALGCADGIYAGFPLGDSIFGGSVVSKLGFELGDSALGCAEGKYVEWLLGIEIIVAKALGEIL